MTAFSALQGIYGRASGTGQGMALMLFSALCFVLSLIHI